MYTKTLIWFQLSRCSPFLELSSSLAISEIWESTISCMKSTRLCRAKTIGWRVWFPHNQFCNLVFQWRVTNTKYPPINNNHNLRHYKNYIVVILIPVCFDPLQKVVEEVHHFSREEWHLHLIKDCSQKWKQNWVWKRERDWIRDAVCSHWAEDILGIKAVV